MSRQSFLARLLCSAACAGVLAGGGAAARGAGAITVDASGGISIARQLYGANNMWAMVPAGSFVAFSDSLRRSAGVTLLRYPGGFESEHYRWDDNSLDPTYRHYTAVSSADPVTVIKTWGAGNVAFVVKTQDALLADTPEAYAAGAAAAAQLVTRYSDRVRDWEIGNEWFNQAGAHQDEAGFLRRYATLLTDYVPAMKAAALKTGHPIRVYAVARWQFPDELTTLRQTVPRAVWAQVDGLDLHAYTGVDPKGDGAVPVQSVATTLEQDKAASGKTRLFVSEWAATLAANDRRGGLENADVLVQIVGQFARAGVTMAAYWPPVITSPAQADHITLLHDAAPYVPDADGQALQWLSEDYAGKALPVIAHGTTAAAVAARLDANTVAVFVAGGDRAVDEQEQVRVVGIPIRRVVTARVLWADPAHADGGPAQIAAVPTTLRRAGGATTVTFTIDPGSRGRGRAWEIVELVVSATRE